MTQHNLHKKLDATLTKTRFAENTPPIEDGSQFLLAK